MACVLALALSLVTVRVARADGDFDFDLGEKKPAALDMKEQKRVEEIAAKVKLRRRILTAHQAFGIGTLVLLAATLVLGTLDYVDKFDKSGEYTEVYNTPHLVLAGISSATFATTAILALAAPNPYPKKLKFDSAMVHKLSMALAAACFVADLILGPISARVEPGTLAQRDFAGAHLGLGYASFALMAVGTLSFVIK